MSTKRFATRDFKDAGTGQNFNAGDELKDITEGQRANYEAAGLAGDQAPAKAAAEKPTEGHKA